MLHDAEDQRGRAVRGRSCVCGQQEMRDASEPGRHRGWLRRQNLEIPIMFTLGQQINFPGFPTKHGPRSE